MTRDEFLKFIDRELESVRTLFNIRNDTYGTADEAFYNFKESARRMFLSGTPEDAFCVLMVLMDKHMIALSKGGIQTSECPERLRDIIVYSLIGLGLYEEFREEQRG